MRIPRLVIAGTTSNVGKTSITCAIIYGLQKKGFSVQSFKVGPDYIDPSYLSTLSGSDSINLDFWLMGRDHLIESFVNNSKSDISVIEGVMGYYDGFDGKSNISSTYHVAELTKSPTILILDASKTARSIAATVLGFLKFQKNSLIKGIILNKIGSKKHEKLCRDALEFTNLPILGAIPKDDKLILKSRHLGLIPTHENQEIKQKIKKISKSILDYLNIDDIIKITCSLPSIKKPAVKKTVKPKTTIGVALDNSFNFYYKDNLDSLQRCGAKLEFFSPLTSKRLPKIHGLYIGGGFPEVLGNSLEKNSQMKRIIKKFAEDELPIYAECGGLMYLTKSINYGKKNSKMIGLFDAETVMTKKMILNYTKGSSTLNSIIFRKNIKFHGHEFHYSKLQNISPDSTFAYDLDLGVGIKNGKDGLTMYNTLASYGHLYFGNSNVAQNLVHSCLKVSRR